MKKSIKRVLIFALLLSMLTVLPCVANAEDQKIMLSDYYIPFDVWQGNGTTSVTVKYHTSDEIIEPKLRFENFNKLLSADGNPTDG